MGPRRDRRGDRPARPEQGVLSMSSSSWRRVFAAAVAAVAALSLSGCGASQPGAAAKVGDQTVTASDVNRLTDGYCAAFEPQFTADGTVLPLQVVRGYVAG